LAYLGSIISAAVSVVLLTMTISTANAQTPSTPQPSPLTKFATPAAPKMPTFPDKASRNRPVKQGGRHKQGNPSGDASSGSQGN